jgi:FemAB-related protein (PEP-CTERM system-associated)
MDIRLATSQDKFVWDAYVDDRPDTTAYCRFSWKDAVEQAYGHKACYLLAEDKGVIKGILPLFIFHIPFGGDSLISLPFCDVGDVFADDDSIKNALLIEAKALAKKNKINTLSIRSCQEGLLGNDIGECSNNAEMGKVRMLLALPGSSEELWKKFKSKLRSQVRKAEKNDLTFRWGNLEDLDCFYEVFSSNMHTLGSPVHSKKWIENIIINYGASARMGLVFKENQPVGCGIILFTKHTVSIPWASTLREFNRLSPNMLLYWNFLKYAADNEKKVFDFGRSTLNEGTYRFKKQWGAEPEPLYWHQVSLSAKKQLTKPKVKKSVNREIIAGLWSKMPLSLANLLGPKLRKYISL